jgi:DNA repair protein RecO (recombination protein O)
VGEQKVHCVSLGGYAYGEGDRLIVLYTREMGKVKAAAKGVRKAPSKLSVFTELFSESEVLLTRRPGAEIYRLIQGRLIRSRRKLKERLASIAALQVLADVLRKALPDDEPQEELYDLLSSTLDRLEGAGDRPEAALSSFLLRFLDMGGYPLRMDACGLCGEKPKGAGRLSARRGGWICADCGAPVSEGPEVQANVLGLLRKLRGEGKGVLSASDAPRARAAFRAASAYLIVTLEDHLPSVDYFFRVTDSIGR